MSGKAWGYSFFLRIPKPLCATALGYPTQTAMHLKKACRLGVQHSQPPTKLCHPIPHPGTDLGIGNPNHLSSELRGPRTWLHNPFTLQVSNEKPEMTSFHLTTDWHTLSCQHSTLEGHRDTPGLPYLCHTCWHGSATCFSLLLLKVGGGVAGTLS